jgi:hypothetical protein
MAGMENLYTNVVIAADANHAFLGSHGISINNNKPTSTATMNGESYGNKPT